MKIDIIYLNNESVNQTDKTEATWYSRRKSYESEQMDEDMKACTISHFADRVILNDIQINDLIEFLNNSKESFKY